METEKSPGRRRRFWQIHDKWLKFCLVVALLILSASGLARSAYASSSSTEPGSRVAAVTLEAPVSGPPVFAALAPGPASSTSVKTCKETKALSGSATAFRQEPATAVQEMEQASSGALLIRDSLLSLAAAVPGSEAVKGSIPPKVVVIDPGHQGSAIKDFGVEPIGPGSRQMKAKIATGTRGVVTGVAESQLALTIALKLRDVLKVHGVKVVMTRTTQNIDLSNIQRAKIANAAHAVLAVRIHADGSTDKSVHGIHVLYPASIKGWTSGITVASKRAASLAEQDLVAATGARNLGLNARSDITGFNWSTVPVILPEIGFMTNPAEDRLLETSSYQAKIVNALARAILAFIGAR